jgi:hypothetical protein
MSDYFLVANGVKLGGVLSRVIFRIYIDGLVALLAKAGCGCYIGKHFMGTLAYADDIVLLASSPTALRKMPKYEIRMHWIIIFASMPKSLNV